MSKILLISNTPTINTGFSKGIRCLGSQLKKLGHDIIYLGMYASRSPELIESAANYDDIIYTTRMNANGMQMCMRLGFGEKKYFKLIGRSFQEVQGDKINLSSDNSDILGKNVIYPIIMNEKVDLVIILEDIWNVIQYSDIINECGVHSIAWVMVDSDKYYYDVSKINMFDRIWVSDDISANTIAEHVSDTPIDVVGWPIDTSRFNTIDDEVKIAEIRSRYEIKPNDFVILSVGRNIQRKRLYAMIDLLSKFVEEVEDPDSIKMIIKTTAEAGRYPDLMHYASQSNVNKNLILIKDDVIGGISEDQMNELYNISDVQVLLTMGEGFCFNGDNAVLTTHGFKKIKSLEIGEKVIGIYDSINTVLSKTKANLESAIHIKLESGEVIEASDEHIITTDKGLVSLKDVLGYIQDGIEVKLLVNDITSRKFDIDTNTDWTKKLYGTVSHQVESGDKKYTNIEMHYMGRAMINGRMTLPRTGQSWITIPGVKNPSKPHRLYRLASIFWKNLTGSRIDKIPVSIISKLRKCEINAMLKGIRDQLNKSSIEDKRVNYLHGVGMSYLSKIANVGKNINYGIDRISPTMVDVIKIDKKFDKCDIVNDLGDGFIEVGIESIRRLTPAECKKRQFYHVFMDNNHTLNLYGIPIDNCVPLAEGLAAGTFAITTKYASPSSWGQNILGLIEYSGDFIDHQIGVRRVVVNTDDAVKKLVEFYNGILDNVGPKSEDLREFVVNNLSIPIFASKISKSIENIKTSDIKSISATIVLLSKVNAMPTDDFNGSILNLHPDIMWLGVRSQKMYTTSMSLIWNDNVNDLEDDNEYIIIDPRFNITPQKLDSLYDEWDKEGILVPSIMMNDSDMTGFSINNGSVVNGNDYIIGSCIIGYGRDIKNIEMSEYKTDSSIIFKNSDVIRISKTSVSNNYIRTRSDPYYIMDITGTMCKHEDYEESLLLPGFGVIEVLRLSKYLVPTAVRFGKVVGIEPLYTWAYPDKAMLLDTVDSVVRHCGNNKQSFVLIPDDMPDTLEWKLGKGYISQESACERIERAIIASKASDVKEADNKTVVVVENLDIILPGIKYVVGLSLEQVRYVFPHARLDIPRR